MLYNTYFRPSASENDTNDTATIWAWAVCARAAPRPQRPGTCAGAFQLPARPEAHCKADPATGLSRRDKPPHGSPAWDVCPQRSAPSELDRKSTRLNSSHLVISY